MKNWIFLIAFTVCANIVIAQKPVDVLQRPSPSLGAVKLGGDYYLYIPDGRMISPLTQKEACCIDWDKPAIYAHYTKNVL
jgi:hypothetical protein